MNVGRELLNVPFPELVKNLGVGIAEAQFALDRISIRIAQMMSGHKLNENGQMIKDESSLIVLKEGSEGVSLLALGFTPTFYQFVETYIELKMAISVTSSKETSRSASAGAIGFGFTGIVAASVNASYSQKFQYDSNGSSEMRTKLVTVPAPAVFESRIRELMNETEPSS